MLIDKICGLRLFNNPSRNKSTRKARFRAAQTDGSGTTAQPQELTESLTHGFHTVFKRNHLCESQPSVFTYMGVRKQSGLRALVLGSLAYFY